ncbi:proline and serine-rich protein 2 isoform X1 [Conger conger]|uniref:proline and serine-rich protein 2 isoform X1 n=1 Tax=Conger conger TaxID=82655 RepID=UPI002A59F46A|nr:proline and serine-rich protein 2 isoform X1 [Conger conger]XP_061109208.1 proline and serine-rich protein 2 isoform X1 [Conger conger]
MDYHSFHDFGVNGVLERSKRNAEHRKPREDEGLQFLSREEKECILFFEETIGSLDDESEDPGLGLSSGSSTSVDGRSAAPSPVPVPVPATASERAPSPKEHDIIDLVQSQHVPTEPREIPFNPPMPDYRTMGVTPETHFEMKARRETMENFPADFQFPPPPPSALSAPDEESYSNSLYQPAGSVPTPVLIAQKIAQHQGSGAKISPSSLLSSRRTSTDSQSPPPDSPVRQGPPTLAKPSRFPENISFILGNREYNQTIAKAAVNVNERRAKVLANLTGGPLALDPEEQSGRNIPNRSCSFQDPSPDKSRMEALSKLGLVHKRSFPGSHSRVITPASQSPTVPETSSSNVGNYDSNPRALASTTTSASDFNSFGAKSKVVSPLSMLPSKMDADSNSIITDETKPPLVSQSSLDGSPVDFNSYGGKTIIMNPSVGSVPKRDSSPQPVSSYESVPSAVRPPTRATAGWAEAPQCDFNICGGKTKVITPAHASTAKTETSSESFVPPDSKARPPAASYLPSYKAEAYPSDSSSSVHLNSYGGKSKAVNPSLLSGPKPEVAASDLRPAAPQPSITPKPFSYRAEPRPSEAPKPASGSRGGSLLPEPRRRAVSKPSLFPQGVTVQFSGRGSTDESRRDALRKLGLLKNTP